MLAEGRTALLLRDESGQPQGWIRMRHLVLRGLQEEEGVLAAPVGQLPCAGVVAVPATASVGECARLFRETGMRQFLVVGSGGQELGVLYLEDLLAATARSLGQAARPLAAVFGTPGSRTGMEAG
jgi:CBS domain-containing protein